MPKKGDEHDEQTPERAPQRLSIKVENSDHIETNRPRSLRDQAGIVGGCQRVAGRIISAADDQCNARLRRLGYWPRSRKEAPQKDEYEIALRNRAGD
ncbi:MAG TPA: hypothetical protein VF396_10595 [Bradyrhizobium sp.]